METGSNLPVRRQVWQLPDWPNWHWDDAQLAGSLAEARQAMTVLRARMEPLDISDRHEALLLSLTDTALLSSEIEGEILRADSVRSSIARRINIEVGLNPAPLSAREAGMIDMTLDAVQRADEPLTAERLGRWQAGLFPDGFSNGRPIVTGRWRPASPQPMQVVSGKIDNLTVHFEAPGGEHLPRMMGDWLRWAETPSSVEPLVRAAVGHLWFETIHPFDDGNGRVGRAVTDLMLARSDKAAGRYFSLSAQIRRDRNDYYDELEKAQAGTLDATRWIAWFLGCLARAANASNTVFERVLRRAAFWKNPRALECNSRQRKALSRMLEGFEGEMKARKYANLTRCSTDTATRDLAELVELGLLRHNGKGGRSSGYVLPD